MPLPPLEAQFRLDTSQFQSQINAIRGQVRELQGEISRITSGLQKTSTAVARTATGGTSGSSGGRGGQRSGGGAAGGGDDGRESSAIEKRIRRLNALGQAYKFATEQNLNMIQAQGLHTITLEALHGKTDAEIKALAEATRGYIRNKTAVRTVADEYKNLDENLAITRKGFDSLERQARKTREEIARSARKEALIPDTQREKFALASTVDSERQRRKQLSDDKKFIAEQRRAADEYRSSDLNNYRTYAAELERIGNRYEQSQQRQVENIKRDIGTLAEVRRQNIEVERKGQADLIEEQRKGERARQSIIQSARKQSQSVESQRDVFGADLTRQETQRYQRQLNSDKRFYQQKKAEADLFRSQDEQSWAEYATRLDKISKDYVAKQEDDIRRIRESQRKESERIEKRLNDRFAIQNREIELRKQFPKFSEGAIGELARFGRELEEAKRKGILDTATFDKLNQKLHESVRGAEEFRRKSEGIAGFFNNIAANLGRIAVFTIGAGILFRAFEGLVTSLSAIVSQGIKFNAEMEKGQIVIASSLSLTRELVSAQGDVANVAASYPLFLEKAAFFQKELVKLDAQALGDFEELSGVFQQVLNFSQGQVASDRELLKFTVNIANAGRLRLLTGEKLAKETQQILTLERESGQTILRSLGLSIEQARVYKEQGTLIQELNKRLDIYTIIAKDLGQTFEGLVSSVQSFGKLLIGARFEDVFRAAKQVLFGLGEELLRLSEEATAFRLSLSDEELQQLGRSLARSFASLVDALVRITAKTIEFIEASSPIIDVFSQATEVVGGFTSGLISGVAKGISLIGQLISETERYIRVNSRIDENGPLDSGQGRSRVRTTIAERAGFGAVVGAGLGSIAPGFGTVLGGIAGLAIGGTIGAIEGNLSEIYRILSNFSGRALSEAGENIKSIVQEIEALGTVVPQNQEDIDSLTRNFGALGKALNDLAKQAKENLDPKDLIEFTRAFEQAQALLDKSVARIQKTPEQIQADAARDFFTKLAEDAAKGIEEAQFVLDQINKAIPTTDDPTKGVPIEQIRAIKEAAEEFVKSGAYQELKKLPIAEQLPAQTKAFEDFRKAAELKAKPQIILDDIERGSKLAQEAAEEFEKLKATLRDLEAENRGESARAAGNFEGLISAGLTEARAQFDKDLARLKDSSIATRENVAVLQEQLNVRERTALLKSLDTFKQVEEEKNRILKETADVRLEIAKASLDAEEVLSRQRQDNAETELEILRSRDTDIPRQIELVQQIGAEELKQIEISKRLKEAELSRLNATIALMEAELALQQQRSEATLADLERRGQPREEVDLIRTQQSREFDLMRLRIEAARESARGLGQEIDTFGDKASNSIKKTNEEIRQLTTTTVHLGDAFAKAIADLGTGMGKGLKGIKQVFKQLGKDLNDEFNNALREMLRKKLKLDIDFENNFLNLGKTLGDAFGSGTQTAGGFLEGLGNFAKNIFGGITNLLSGRGGGSGGNFLANLFNGGGFSSARPNNPLDLFTFLPGLGGGQFPLISGGAGTISGGGLPGIPQQPTGPISGPFEISQLPTIPNAGGLGQGTGLGGLGQLAGFQGIFSAITGEGAPKNKGLRAASGVLSAASLIPGQQQPFIQAANILLKFLSPFLDSLFGPQRIAKEKKKIEDFFEEVFDNKRFKVVKERQAAAGFAAFPELGAAGKALGVDFALDAKDGNAGSVVRFAGQALGNFERLGYTSDDAKEAILELADAMDFDLKSGIRAINTAVGDGIFSIKEFKEEVKEARKNLKEFGDTSNLTAKELTDLATANGNTGSNIVTLNDALAGTIDIATEFNPLIDAAALANTALADSFLKAASAGKTVDSQVQALADEIRDGNLSVEEAIIKFNQLNDALGLPDLDLKDIKIDTKFIERTIQAVEDAAEDLRSAIVNALREGVKSDASVADIAKKVRHDLYNAIFDAVLEAFVDGFIKAQLAVGPLSEALARVTKLGQDFTAGLITQEDFVSAMRDEFSGIAPTIDRIATAVGLTSQEFKNALRAAGVLPDLLDDAAANAGTLKDAVRDAIDAGVKGARHIDIADQFRNDIYTSIYESVLDGFVDGFIEASLAAGPIQDAMADIADLNKDFLEGTITQSQYLAGVQAAFAGIEPTVERLATALGIGSDALKQMLQDAGVLDNILGEASDSDFISALKSAASSAIVDGVTEQKTQAEIQKAFRRLFYRNIFEQVVDGFVDGLIKALTISGPLKSLFDNIGDAINAFAQGGSQEDFFSTIQDTFTQMAPVIQTIAEAVGIAAGHFTTILQEAGIFEDVLGDASDEAKELAKELRQAAQDLLLDDSLSPLKKRDRLPVAQQEFEQLRARALAGDKEAARQLPEAGRRLLEIARDIFASSLPYEKIFDFVRGTLLDVANVFGPIEDQATEQLRTIKEIRDAARTTNQILETRLNRDYFNGILDGTVPGTGTTTGGQPSTAGGTGTTSSSGGKTTKVTTLDRFGSQSPTTAGANQEDLFEGVRSVYLAITQFANGINPNVNFFASSIETLTTELRDILATEGPNTTDRTENLEELKISAKRYITKLEEFRNAVKNGDDISISELKQVRDASESFLLELAEVQKIADEHGGKASDFYRDIIDLAQKMTNALTANVEPGTGALQRSGAPVRPGEEGKGALQRSGAPIRPGEEGRGALQRSGAPAGSAQNAREEVSITETLALQRQVAQSTTTIANISQQAFTFLQGALSTIEGHLSDSFLVLNEIRAVLRGQPGNLSQRITEGGTRVLVRQGDVGTSTTDVANQGNFSTSTRVVGGDTELSSLLSAINTQLIELNGRTQQLLSGVRSDLKYISFVIDFKLTNNVGLVLESILAELRDDSGGGGGGASLASGGIVTAPVMQATLHGPEAVVPLRNGLVDANVPALNSAVNSIISTVGIGFAAVSSELNDPKPHPLDGVKVAAGALEVASASLTKILTEIKNINASAFNKIDLDLQSLIEMVGREGALLRSTIDAGNSAPTNAPSTTPTAPQEKSDDYYRILAGLLNVPESQVRASFGAGPAPSNAPIGSTIPPSQLLAFPYGREGYDFLVKSGAFVSSSGANKTIKNKSHDDFINTLLGTPGFAEGGIIKAPEMLIRAHGPEAIAPLRDGLVDARVPLLEKLLTTPIRFSPSSGAAAQIDTGEIVEAIHELRGDVRELGDRIEDMEFIVQGDVTLDRKKVGEFVRQEVNEELRQGGIRVPNNRVFNSQFK